jgi:hypothetical protein
MLSGLLQLRPCPASTLGHGFILIERQSVHNWQKLQFATITDCNEGVATETGMLGAADGGAAEGFSELVH